MDIFSAFGLSASAGLNAYIPLLVVGLLGRYTNLLTLKSPWDTLTNEWVLLVLAVLLLIEILADKIPAVNHLNDGIQTFIRPVAGAILFAASAHVVTDLHPVLAMIAGVLVAGGVHAVKSLAVRPAVTVTTAGVGNIVVSTLEDIAAVVMSVLSIIIPVLFAVILFLVILWLSWKLLRRATRQPSVT